MLYKIGGENKKFDKLEPMPYKDFSNFGKLEKELEELIAKNILDTLFYESGLMTIYQQVQYQSVADIYALNKKGELVIFELKRADANEYALTQILGYAQDAGQWTYSELQKKYESYCETNTESIEVNKNSQKKIDLIKAHQVAFALDEPLEKTELNKKQHLMIIASAADDKLMNSVSYWKNQGISIDFLPYRIYEIEGENFFEFFALPYDKHRNPNDIKGVLFDTNRSWDENFIWYMIDNNCVAANGDAKRFINYIYSNDIIFLSHRYAGLVAAARVKNGSAKIDGDTLYRDVTFITPTPKKGEQIKAIPFKEVSKITGKSFFWARTIKVPYLSKKEAEKLAIELKNYLNN